MPYAARPSRGAAWIASLSGRISPVAVPLGGKHVKRSQVLAAVQEKQIHILTFASPAGSCCPTNHQLGASTTSNVQEDEGRCGRGRYGRWSLCQKTAHFCHLPPHMGSRCQARRNSLAGMTWFGQRRGGKDLKSAFFSFHTSQPRHPQLGPGLYLCLSPNTVERWTAPRARVIHKLRNNWPKRRLSHC